MYSDIPWGVHLLTRIFLEMILCFSFPDINKTQAKGKSYLPQNKTTIFLHVFISTSIPLVIKRLRAGLNVWVRTSCFSNRINKV